MNVLKWACVLAMVSSAWSYAGEVLKVGVENIDYAPYYSLQGKEYTGHMRDLLDAFAQKNGLKIEYVPLPVARLFKDMIDGKLDIKAPDHPYWSAEDKKKGKIIYSEDVVSAQEGVMIPTSKVGKIKKEDIKVIGTVTGFTPFGILDLIKEKKVKIVENANLEGLLTQVLNNRIDAAYVEELVAQNVLKKLGKKGDELTMIPEMPIDKHNFKISLQEKHTKIKELFDAFLKTEEAKKILEKNGVYLK